MTTDFARTRQVVEREVGEGLFTCGAQISVLHHNESVLDLAFGASGLPGPLTPETIFRVYCTIKPVLAVAVANQVARGAIDLDQPLADALERPSRLPLTVTARTVLTHTAGLHYLPALSLEFLTPERREEMVASAKPPSAWRVGRDAGYSEYLGWHFLAWWLEELSGEPLRDHLRRTILDPLSLSNTWIGMTEDDYRDVLPDLGLNHHFLNGQMYPMVVERSQRMACETNPAHGGYTNARDLASFYGALIERLAGGGIDALPPAPVLSEFCSTARPTAFDVILQRKCEFGLGFMTKLGDHFFGNACSSSSFGHSGNVGSSFAFGDPSSDLAVGVVFNGLAGSDAAFLRRRVLVDAIYEDLGLVGRPSAELSVARPRRGRLRRERA